MVAIKNNKQTTTERIQKIVAKLDSIWNRMDAKTITDAEARKLLQETSAEMRAIQKANTLKRFGHLGITEKRR